MSRSDTGRPAAEIRAAHQAACDQAELTTLCAFCPWTYTGTALQGRQLAEDHRRRKHPDLKPAKRRRSNIRRFNVSDDQWREGGLANAEAVAEMHRRREGRAA